MKTNTDREAERWDKGVREDAYALTKDVRFLDLRATEIMTIFGILNLNHDGPLVYNRARHAEAVAFLNRG